MNLSRTFAGLTFEHPIMNAAGTCKTFEQVRDLARSAVSAVMVGSVTVEPRDGNPAPNYWSGPLFSLNSLGLPNPGIKYYMLHVPVMAHLCHDLGKPLFVSVAGFSPDEYAQMTYFMLDAGADLVEQNLGCPNVWGKDGQKPVASFNEELIIEITERTREAVGDAARVIAKVSPFTNPLAIQSLAGTFDAQGFYKGITGTNTLPNCLGFAPDGNPRIGVGKGLAGGAGPALKPLALGNVFQWREALSQHIGIIAAGGISTGQDWLDYERADATLGQVATAYLEQGPRIFEQILAEVLSDKAD